MTVSTLDEEGRSQFQFQFIAPSPSPGEVRARIQGRNLDAGPRSTDHTEGLLTSLLSMACPAYSHTPPPATKPRSGTTHSELGSPFPILKAENTPTFLPTHQSGEGLSQSRLALLRQMTLASESIEN